MQLRDFLHSILIIREGLLTVAVGAILALILPPVLQKTLKHLKKTEPNFRGDEILTSFGALIALWAIPMLLEDAWLFPDRREERFLWVGCVAGFSVLGWIDDTWGDKKSKGLRGHLMSLVQDRRVTTGLVKAGGGLLLSVWLAHSLAPENLGRCALMTFLIALSANAVNLLDLRPGRAGGAFLFAALLIVILLFLQSHTLFVPGLLYVILPALIVWERDSRAEVMMGDTGSNPLGGALGFAVCLYANLSIQIAACLSLVALHALTERISLTRLIEQAPLLKWLDGMTGERN